MSSEKEILAEKSLKYHMSPAPGKLSIVPSKPCATQEDLSLAYTPGVAVPCMEIHHDVEKSFLYTNRSNCVAVVSDGTAVLGLQGVSIF